MAATALLLVRHGESLANVAAAEAERTGAERVEVPMRDADVPLTAVGAAQAAAVGGWLLALPAADYPRSVWVSPYLRARQTAEIALAMRPDGHPPRLDERLRDNETGVLDRLTARGIEAREPAEAERIRHQGRYYHRPPGGESWADVALRIRSFLGGLDSEECASTALVFAHDTVVMLFRVVCEGLTELEALELARTPVQNGSITRIVRTNKSAPWRVQYYNSITHLTRPTGKLGRPE
ncbi:histidine phosphatase family protein [Cryobacterium arcticum]|uniref:Histidine phosphatase family protein n=1 Tax=Cryobacterium arcticum TaxID=670052 RepID=A0A317ZQ06_9MICO|nr:histidine phosphatase family protein [Cryobacterium arcticum]PXA65796.1 histidine phosphatase family protein [Cryobacterium arcticum]